METTVLVVIASYLVGVTVVGSVLARRSVGGSAWAVADGRMSLLLVAVGVAGTRIGDPRVVERRGRLGRSAGHGGIARKLSHSTDRK